MFNLYFNRQYIILLALGFSSGVPFLLILSTLSFWLSELYIRKSMLGFLMITSLPYSLKFLWSPFIGTVSLPYFSKKIGYHKSWGLLAQISLIVFIALLGHCRPNENLGICAFLAFLIACCSATQDIVVDAYRINLLSVRSENETLGAGAAMESIGFRLGMLMSGAGTLYLAHDYSWPVAYTVTGITLTIGILALSATKKNDFSPDKNFGPQCQKISLFKECWRSLLSQPFFLSLLGFIMCFKIPDTILNSMSAPFLYGLGFSKIEYAQVSKLFGISLMVIGGIIGSSIIQRLGLRKTIILCCFVQSLSCVMFIIQGWAGHDLNILTLTIGIESLCSGMTTTAFIAYVTVFCRGGFSVSHFTFLSSLGSFSRVFVSVLAGWLAEVTNWTFLFSFACTACIPVIYFLIQTQKYQTNINDILSYFKQPLKRKIL